MKKIKNFKIPVYAHEIARKAKKQGLDLGKMGLGEMRQLKEYASNLAASVASSTIYDYFEPGNHIEIMNLLPPKTSSYTLAILTLGKSIETVKNADNEEESLLIQISAEVFLNTAANFIKDLSKKDAEIENLELSDISILYSPSKNEMNADFLRNLCDKFSSEKIGVIINEKDVIKPRNTMFFILPWTLKKRKSPSSKK